MFNGPEITQIIADLGYTHVIWIPDSTLGAWQDALARSADFQLLRVCREGEAWPLGAGLHLGGQRPLLVMQCTGLFESGDALRNVLFDLRVPLTAIIGHRSFLVPDSPDTARKFPEPILQAWGIDYVHVTRDTDKPQLAAHLQNCLAQEKPGAVLLAEGRM